MRLAVGIVSVALGLGSLSFACAQTETSADRPSPWSWLTTKKASGPPKPSAAPVPSQSPLSKDTGPTHVLRQTTCNIPFTVDLSKNAPVELQLYVSQDRGTSWKFYAKAAPAEGRFSFRAVNDGEYWFALRSVEKSVTPFDLKKLSPGLKVVFDTREPELRFDATLNDSGEVLAVWKINDPTLVAESLKVEYQTDPHTPWRTVMLPVSDTGRDGSLDGNYKWTPEAVGEAVLVRAEISDRAGNKTVVSRRLTPRQVAIGHPTDQFRARSRPAVTYPVAQDGQSWPADNQLPARSQSPPVDSHGELPPPKPSAAEAPSAMRRDAVRNPFISAKQPLPNGQAMSGGEGLIQPSVSQRTSSKATYSTAVEEEITPVVGPLNQSPTAQSVAPQLPTATMPARTVSDASSSGAHSQDASSALPNGERPRMTNTRQFSLDYEIDAMGPTGVAKVELWGTADGGRTWKHWQEDADRQSPLDLTVDQDGIFGFRIVITGANQLGGAPPQPGDPADLWVGVDTATPTARLTSAIYGDGQHAGQLDIRWQAFDVWFPDRPITLLFSEHPQGPWTTIAAGLPNNGQYFWAVEPRIPRRIYLRLEARDEAGNFAEHQISEAISTAGLVPQGRIRGLRTTSPTPADDRSAARGPTAW